MLADFKAPSRWALPNQDSILTYKGGMWLREEGCTVTRKPPHCSNTRLRLTQELAGPPQRLRPVASGPECRCPDLLCDSRTWQIGLCSRFFVGLLASLGTPVSPARPEKACERVTKERLPCPVDVS